MEGFALPEGNRLGPNCGVTAVAIIARVPFDTVWNMFRVWRRSNWKGWSTTAQQLQMLDLLKVRYEVVPTGRRQTLEQFADNNLEGRYLVRVHRHVTVVYAGFIADQKGVVPANEHSHRDRRVLTIVKILEA